MGQDSEYKTLANQIMVGEKVPNFKEAPKLVVWEESTRQLWHNLKSSPESTVFAARKGKEPQGQPVSTEHKDTKQWYVKGDANTDPKVHLFCTHHKKRHHTMETCWEIHGKPKYFEKSKVSTSSRILQLWALRLCSCSIQTKSKLPGYKRRLKH